MRDMISRRHALAALGASALTSPLGAFAQAWPSRPVRVVVPTGAGATVDNLARNVCTTLAERWGVPVVVDNKPGASSIIGSDAVAKAPADGYTILFAAVTLVQIPHLFRKLPFDPMTSFEPIAQTGQAPVWFVAHKDLPVSSIKEFVELAKKSPSKYSFASAGEGTTPHLYGAELSRQMGGALLHVPYKGTAPSMVDLLEGRVSSLFVNYSDVRQHVQAGRLKVFASTGPKRSQFTPEVPTMLEAGFPGFETLSWTGFFAPAGTPASIVQKIAVDIREAARKPEFQKRLQELCVEPVDSDPASFSKMLKEEYAGWGRIVANAGVKLD